MILLTTILLALKINGGVTMEKEKVVSALAKYFEIEPEEETGNYDLSGYDWTSGCGFGGGIWLSLANVIEALENADLIE